MGYGWGLKSQARRVLLGLPSPSPPLASIPLPFGERVPCYAVQLPDLPPDFARTRMSVRTIVLSIALAMS